MTKIKFLSLLVATLFITSCNNSTSSSDISSSSLSSISNTDSNSTSSSIVKDYGTTYDEFDKMSPKKRTKEDIIELCNLAGE